METFGEKVTREAQRSNHNENIVHAELLQLFPALTGPQAWNVIDGYGRLVGSRDKLLYEDIHPPMERYISADNGWLSPSGKFYSCRYGGHDHLARWLKETEHGLEEEGWIKVQRHSSEDTYHFYHCKDFDGWDTRDVRPTETQIRLVRERCLELGRKDDIPWYAWDRSEDE
jgi:hypothetical protein